MAEACGAQHPTKAGVKCERELCVEYHLAEGVVWTEGATPLPPKDTDAVKVLGIVQRTQAKARRDRR